jgi:hypothetical protein
VRKLLSVSFDQEVNFWIQDSLGRYCCVSLRRANEIIGTTTEELVLKAQQGVMTNPWCCPWKDAFSYPPPISIQPLSRSNSSNSYLQLSAVLTSIAGQNLDVLVYLTAFHAISSSSFLFHQCKLGSRTKELLWGGGHGVPVVPGAHWRFSSVNICKCWMHATSQIPRKVVFALGFGFCWRLFILAHKTIAGLNTFMVLGYCLRGHLHII